MPLPQHLTIGLLSHNPGWEILLEQIGAIWEVIPATAELTAARYSVIIANGSASNATMFQRLVAYVEEGGSLLEEGSELSNTIFRAGQPSRGEQPDSGMPTPFPFRNGNVLPLGMEVGKQAADTRARRRLFAAPSAILPSEIVARGNKGEQRMLIHFLLSRLHSLRGLPFVTRWRFPNNAPTIFCYRIDSDHGTQSQIEQLHHLSLAYQLPITWFLHTEAHQGWLGRFAEFEGDELGVHCHRHRTFKGYRENVENIRRAMELLRQHGITPRGFAAPNGFWNPAVADAVADCGFLYSSEFSLGYDDLPFFPWLRWRGRFGTLQVPIHPVSPGNFRRVGVATAQMIEHYQTTLQSKFMAAEPVIFYHHPTHQQWGVTEAIFADVRRHNIPAITMGQYAEWWVRRSNASVRAAFHNGLLTVATQSADGGDAPSDLWISVEHHCEKGALIPANATVRLEDIRWEREVRLPAKPQPVPSFNFKMLFHSVEDSLTRLRQ